MSEGSLAGLWSRLISKRQHHLDRARACSALTLPFISPPEGMTGATELPTPYQGDGARGVNNVSAKLLLTQFPANSSFFRLEPDKAALVLAGEVAPESIDQIRQTLVGIESAVLHELETTAFRPVAFEVFRNLVITGNALFEWRKNNPPRVFALDRYCVVRDGEGRPTLVLLKESQTPEDPTEKDQDLHTLYELKGDKWTVRQELDGAPTGKAGKIDPKDLPVLPLRMNRVQGEHYGRGLIEEYLGDLHSLEALQQALVEGAAAAARLVFLVNPSGTTNLNHLAKARNGGFVRGNPEDIKALQLEKLPDFQFALQTANGIRERIARAFLMNTSIQRDAERVTAEEIRYMAQELENTFGGTYSLLSQEFQLPLVRMLLRRLAAEGRVLEVPEGVAEPRIVTGVEALGRGQEALRLRTLIGDIAGTFGPEAVGTYLNPTGTIRRMAIAGGVDPDGVVRTEEEIQQIQQAQQAQQLAQSVAPNVVNAISKANQQPAAQ